MQFSVITLRKKQIETSQIPLKRLNSIDLIQKMPSALTQSEAQRSGFDLERRSDGVNER
jgi:hypothetical protein